MVNLPVRWQPTLRQRFVAWELASRNLRRMLTRAVGEHLEQAGVLLDEVGSVEALMLAASRTAGVVAVIDRHARELGVPLPAEVVNGAVRCATGRGAPSTSWA